MAYLRNEEAYNNHVRDQQSMVLDGNTAYGYIADTDKLSFTNGTKDREFSIGIRIINYQPMINTATVSLVGKGTINSNTQEYQLYLSSGNKLGFAVYDYTNLSYIYFTSNQAIKTGFTGSIIATYDGLGLSTSLKVYIDGILVQGVTALSGTIYTCMRNLAEEFRIGRLLSSYNRIEYNSIRVFNFCLKEADVKILSMSAVPTAYNGTFNVDLFGGNGFFTTDTSTYFSYGNSTSVWNSTNSSIINTTTTTGTPNINKVSIATMGKYYRVKFKAKSDTYTTPIAGASWNATYALIPISNPSLTSIFQEYVFEGVCIHTNFYILLQSTGIIGNTIEIKDIEFYHLGCIMDLSQENITYGGWSDKSPNGLDATFTGTYLFNRGNHLTPLRMFQMASTGVTISNSAVETSLLDGGFGSKIIQRNSLRVGSVIRLTCNCRLSSGSSQGSTVRIKFGGVTLVTNTANLPNGLSSNSFKLTIDLLVLSTGASGTMKVLGKSDVLQANLVALARDLDNVTATTINTTIDNAVDLTYQFTNASTSNVCVSHMAMIQLL